MGLVTKQNAFARKAALLILFAQELGLEVSIGSVLRSEDEQARKVAAGVSKTMSSKHLKKLAIDLNLFRNGSWITDKYDPAFRLLGEHWIRIGGNNWGGRFGVEPEHYDTDVGWDPGHFEC
jgi:hypothetical protein